ncbi:hypothetical protein H0H92_007315 [Tricholoma furcatifolium]|nr:hypothetical protein H0H92_007315 [Tricholoma furcatifolium]
MLKKPFKTGPIPLAMLEELHIIYEDFQHKTIALAKRINKLPEALFSQAWRAKYGEEKSADVPPSKWTKMMTVEYNEFIEKELEGKPNTSAN